MDSILSAHITHKQASMAEIERFGDMGSERITAAIMAMPGVKECIVLRTCNRIELYMVTQDMSLTRRAVERLINSFVPYDAKQNLVQYLSGRDSVRHILRVSTGLESLIIGEDQIQNQVRTAFEQGEKEGTVGPSLSVVFRKAISTGKKVRSETRLNKGCVSVGSAAVEMAEDKLGTLEGKNILVLGAGEMATLIAKHLVGKRPQAVFVSNRTYSRAVELAWDLDGKAVRFDSLIEFMAQSDVVLVATSATHKLIDVPKMEMAMAFREKETDIIVIDVSFPSNVDPLVSTVPGAQLIDIDGLRGLAEENILRRKEEITAAEHIITEELDILERRMKEMRVDQLLGRLCLKMDELKEREVRRAMNRLNAGHDTAETVLRDFANVMTSKFLADPMEALKNASREGDTEMFSIVQGLFKLEGESYVPRKQTTKIADEPGH